VRIDYSNGSTMKTGACSIWEDLRFRKHMALIGSKGGRKGGKATGASKRRSREHYARIAEIQRQRWRKWRLARGVNGSTKPIRNGSAKATGA
jgi:hypothetical protein